MQILVFQMIKFMKLNNFKRKYQPSGKGGTCSPPAAPHCLQNPKWPTGSGKVSTSRFLGILSNFR